MGVKEALKSDAGAIIISIVLGLGIAALFRKVCEGKQCIVLTGPNMEEVREHTYKINDDCFRYEPVFSECDA